MIINVLRPFAAVILALGLVAISHSAFAQEKVATTGVCSRCHELAKVLPDGHPKVAATGIAACSTCHDKAKVGASAANPFSTRLHTAHAQADTACSVCHQWKPGKEFTAAGFKHGVAPLAGDEFTLVMKAMKDWAGSGNLDSIHRGKNVTCTACHGKDLIPDSNMTAVNGQCVSCHGGLEKVAASFKGASYLNPHASHLGPIACTTCHNGHKESKAYCLDCHANFKMPIPGGAPAAAKPTGK